MKGGVERVEGYNPFKPEGSVEVGCLFHTSAVTVSLFS